MLLWSFVHLALLLVAVLAICTVIYLSKIYDDDDDVTGNDVITVQVPVRPRDVAALVQL